MVTLPKRNLGARCLFRNVLQKRNMNPTRRKEILELKIGKNDSGDSCLPLGLVLTDVHHILELKLGNNDLGGFCLLSYCPNGRAPHFGTQRRKDRDLKKKTTHPMLAIVAMPVEDRELTPGPLAHLRVSTTM